MDNVREEKSELVQFNIVETKAATKRKASRITFEVTDELLGKINETMLGRLCPDGFPKVMCLRLTWDENITDREET